MKHLASFVVLLALLGGSVSLAAARTWTDATGKYTVEAEFVALQGANVQLRKPDGTRVSVPLARLCEADRQFVQQMAGAPATPAAAEPAAGQAHAEKYFPLTVGSRWKYRVRIPEATTVYYNPYFVDAPGLLGSNVTHGGSAMGPADFTFTITVREKVDEHKVKIDLEDAGRELLLPPVKHQETQLLRFRGDYWGLGLWVVLPSNSGEKPLVVGRDLASVKSTEDAGPGGALEVAAGKFTGVVHCTMPQAANGDYTPDFREEAWLAPGVGLVKFVAKDAGEKLIYTMELVEYAPPQR